MPRTSARMLVLFLIAGLSAVGVSTASAGGSVSLASSLIGGDCGSTSTPFSSWGDQHAYYLAGGGSFEPGGPQWTLSGGAKVVTGNEPFAVHGASDTSSLLIPAGGSATSPSFCFGLLNPGVRLFATGTGKPATIHVGIVTHGLLGALSVLDGGTVNVGTTWAPTQVLSTTFSQLNVPVGTKSIQLVITSTGSVQIDDVYVDPFCSR